MPKITKRFDPRQTMNGDTFEISHYLDIKTRHLDAHYHDFYEIFCFIDGNVDYWVDGRLYHLQPGDIFLIHPTELHKPIPRAETEQYERIVLWIDKTFLSGIDGGILERCFDTTLPTYRKVLRLVPHERNTVLALAQTLAEEFNNDAFGSAACTYGLLLQFMTQINRIALARSTDSNEPYSTSTFVSDVLAYIQKHYQEPLSLDSLATHFFVSKYHLSHEFKKSVGTGVHRYITLKRLAVAYELLADGIPPNQASAMCGFGDYTNFFRAFKAQYGASPAAFYKP